MKESRSVTLPSHGELTLRTAFKSFSYPVFLLGFSLVCTAFDGAWKDIGNVDGGITGYATLSATQTWMCTTSGKVYFFDGEALSDQTDVDPDLSLSLQGICALDSAHIWVAGYSYSPSPAGGRVYFWDGSEWTLMFSSTLAGNANQFRDVYAASTSRVWVCGNQAQIWGSTNGGVSWDVEYDHVDNKMWYSIDGTDPEHVWVAGIEYVGKHAQILFGDGLLWHTPLSEMLGEGALRDIDAVSTNEVWAIGGNDGAVVRFRNGAWESAAGLAATNASEYSISRTSCGDIWASAYGYGLYFLGNDGWERDHGMSSYTWRSHASPWQVFAEDAVSGLYVRQSYPAVERVQTGIGFAWNAIPGRTYCVEWTDNPLEPEWKAADRLTAGGWTAYWADIGDGTSNRPPPTSSTERLYRVVQH